MGIVSPQTASRSAARLLPRPSGFGGADLRILALVVAFLAVSTGLRAALTTDLNADEAELTAAARTLRGGYSEQPPLYAWALWAVSGVVGPGFAALAVLRVGLLLALAGVTYAAARLVVPDRRLAIPAAASSLLFPSFAWHAATYFTHTLLLAVAVVATVYAVARVVLLGRTRDYLLLGVAVAVGLLAKYNFALVVFAAVAAGLTVPAARARLLDRRILLTAGVALLILLPNLAWLWERSGEVLRLVRWKAGVAEALQYWTVFGRGLWAVAAALAGSLVLAGPLLAWVCRGARRSEPDPAASWLGRFLLALALVHLAVILGQGLTRFPDRWLQPLLLVVPLWCFARLAPDAVSPTRLQVLVGVEIALAAALLVAQVGQVAFVERLPGGHKLRHDYPRLARELEEAGYGHATLVGWDREIIGNLCPHMPDARAFYAKGIGVFERGAGPAVLVWDAATGELPPWHRGPVFAPGVEPPRAGPREVRRFTLHPRPPCRRVVTVLVYELPETW